MWQRSRIGRAGSLPCSQVGLLCQLSLVSAHPRGQERLLAEAHCGGGGREVARYCILHLRGGEGGALTSAVELHVWREPWHRGTARVRGRPCRLQFLVHLLEEGDGTRNWCGGASVKLPVQQREPHTGMGREREPEAAGSSQRN